MNPLKALRDMRTINSLLTDAERRSRAMGEPEPRAEHLLLAALDLPDGSARRVFDRVGVDPDAVAAALVEGDVAVLTSLGIAPKLAGRLRAPAPLDPPGGTGVYRSSPSAQEAFQAAGTMARADRVPLAGAHVVAAVAGMTHGAVARTLTGLGIDAAALTAVAREEAAAGSRSGRFSGPSR